MCPILAEFNGIGTVNKISNDIVDRLNSNAILNVIMVSLADLPLMILHPITKQPLTEFLRVFTDTGCLGGAETTGRTQVKHIVRHSNRTRKIVKECLL